MKIEENLFFLFAMFNVIVITLAIFSYAYMLQWRNWLARWAFNRKVGGSSPPGVSLFLLYFVIKVYGTYDVTQDQIRAKLV